MTLSKLKLFITSGMVYLKAIEAHRNVSTGPHWLSTSVSKVFVVL